MGCYRDIPPIVMACTEVRLTLPKLETLRRKLRCGLVFEKEPGFIRVQPTTASTESHRLLREIITLVMGKDPAFTCRKSFPHDSAGKIIGGCGHSVAQFECAHNVSLSLQTDAAKDVRILGWLRPDHLPCVDWANLHAAHETLKGLRWIAQNLSEKVAKDVSEWLDYRSSAGDADMQGESLVSCTSRAPVVGDLVTVDHLRTFDSWTLNAWDVATVIAIGPDGRQIRLCNPSGQQSSLLAPEYFFFHDQMRREEPPVLHRTLSNQWKAQREARREQQLRRKALREEHLASKAARLHTRRGQRKDQDRGPPLHGGRRKVGSTFELESEVDVASVRSVEM